MTNILEAIEDNFSGEKLPALKFADGDSKKLTFVQEGKIVKTKVGDKAIFVVRIGDDEMNWWMNPNHPLLRQIKAACGVRVVGKTVLVKRKGSGQKDTRYTVEKA